jgi:hypothetical protein
LECWDYSVELECLSGPDGKFLPWYLTLICLGGCLKGSKGLKLLNLFVETGICKGKHILPYHSAQEKTVTSITPKMLFFMI